MKNLKEIIKKHILNNKKEYIIVTLLFIIGIFLGVLFVNNINESQKIEVTDYLNNFIEKMKSIESLDNISLLKTSVIQNVFFAMLGYASEVIIQEDKTGIQEDAVSVVIPKATIYMPFAELVDISKEIERLHKEEEKLTKELARVNGMLGNPNFVSKAPEKKINEEKEKKAKYEQMMEQVKEQLERLSR